MQASLEITHKPVDHRELRQFGGIMGGMIAGLFGLLLPWVFGKSFPNEFPHWPWIALGGFWTLALVAPKALHPIYKGWMKFGQVMGFINTRIILGIVFYLVVTPIGLVRRVFAGDVLGKRPVKDLSSYRKSNSPEDWNNRVRRMNRPF